MAPTSDAELSRRTTALLAAAEAVSRELELQTERLNQTLKMLHEEILEPLREEGYFDGGDAG